MAEGDVSSLPKPRVLIVEDEITVAMRIAGLLEDMGCEPVGPATLQSRHCPWRSTNPSMQPCLTSI